MKSLLAVLSLALATPAFASSAAIIIALDGTDVRGRPASMLLSYYGPNDIELLFPGGMLCSDINRCHNRWGDRTAERRGVSSRDPMTCDRIEVDTSNGALDIRCSVAVNDSVSLIHEIVTEGDKVTRYTKYSDEDERQREASYTPAILKR